MVTDVTKDGTLGGPNLDLLARVAERTDAPVIASGGVSSLDDLRAIATLTGRGVEGAIVGKALYAGRFTLPQALAAVRECGDNGAMDIWTRWSSEASAILDDATEPFLAGHRADSAVQKKGNDFATEVDLAIERQVVAALTRGDRNRRARRGVRRRGRRLADWCGCSTRSTARSTTRPDRRWPAILLGLLHDGDPVAGLTWLPFTDQRYTAIVGGPLMKNGVPQPPLGPVDLSDALIGAGTFNVGLAGPVPGPLPGGGAGEPEPGVVAVAHARRHRPRPGLRRRRNPRRRQSLSAATSGTTPPVWRWCGPRAASSPTWPANPGRPTRSPRWPAAPGAHAEILEIVRGTGRPEDY